MLHDAGTARVYIAHHYETLFPLGFIGFGGTSSMGWSTPAAMGAKLAHPDKVVVNVTGDGSFGMTGMEIETADNRLLVAMGFASQPAKLLYTPAALVIAMGSALVPYMTLSVDSVLQSVPSNLEEAAMDLGAPPLLAFWHVTLPLILPGIVTGFVVSFILSVDAYATPAAGWRKFGPNDEPHDLYRGQRAPELAFRQRDLHRPDRDLHAIQRTAYGERR